LAGWMQEHCQLRVLVTGSLPVTPVPAAVSSLLFRAVRELLLNVSKHAGVKQARVDIIAFNQGLRVTVTDEGAGFDVANALQAPRSYGLFSIQEQLTFHDGALDISSVPQRGTTCTLTIPLRTVEDAGPDVPPAVACSATETADLRHAPADPIRILVADDHPMARGALVQVLGLADDFEVVGEASDGLDALEKTRLLRPDLVLMDATMPRLDGLQATRLITTEFPGIKVIGLSMHARQDMAPQMSAAGAAYYLQKLSPVDELFAAIRDVMNTEIAGGVG
jgi:CheY-like chemotaxis protein